MLLISQISETEHFKATAIYSGACSFRLITILLFIDIFLFLLSAFVFEGVTKPNTVDQPILIGIVLQFVQQFVPDFVASDITWVRSMKASKFGVFNVQCRTVMAASRVRSTFASLVKATPTPTFIGNVTLF